MLRIQVPDWETEREHFRLKLHDYFENIVKLGIETIEKNGNLTEFLGRVITTRKLYDDVAGIQNVKIRLYKKCRSPGPRYPPTPAAKVSCPPS